MSPSPAVSSPAVVLTVDDHPLIRSALREVLCLMSDKVELIEASNAEEGLAALRRRPDVDLVFLDLQFSGHSSGLAYLERYRAVAAAAPLIIYTMHEDAPTLRRALALGAAGIVPKTHSHALLQRAIELVMQGGVYVPPELVRELAGGEAAPAAEAPAAMSRQQRRILELLADGLPNKEIARSLGIAASTVKNQLTAIFDKLGVSNRTQAAIAARQLIDKERKNLE